MKILHTQSFFAGPMQENSQFVSQGIQIPIIEL